MGKWYSLSAGIYVAVFKIEYSFPSDAKKQNNKEK